MIQARAVSSNHEGREILSLWADVNTLGSFVARQVAAGLSVTVSETRDVPAYGSSPVQITATVEPPKGVPVTLSDLDKDRPFGRSPNAGAFRRPTFPERGS